MSESTKLLSEALGKNEKIDLRLERSEVHFHPFYGHGYIHARPKAGQTASLIVERDPKTKRLVLRVATSSAAPAEVPPTKKARKKAAAKKSGKKDS